MQMSTAHPSVRPVFEKKALTFIVFPVIILLLGWLALQAFNLQKSYAPAGVSISQTTLEAQYGLRVNLMAVTAAGGFVDLRLKISDADKAKLLLQDKKNFPALVVAGSNTILAVPEETKSQEIQFENGGNIFLLFPNARNVVKPGTEIRLKFGDLLLEPLKTR